MSPAEQINPFPEVRDSVNVTCTYMLYVAMLTRQFYQPCEGFTNATCTRMPESDSEERAVIFRSATSAVPPGNIPPDRISGRMGRVQQFVQTENQGELLLHSRVLEPVREM